MSSRQTGYEMLSRDAEKEDAKYAVEDGPTNTYLL